MKCKAQNKNGTQCGAKAIANEEFCFFHNPNKTQLKQSAQKGGKASTKQDYIQLDTFPVEEAMGVMCVLTDTINRVRLARPDGTMDLKTANTIGFLASKILEAKKVMTYEENIIKRSIFRNEKIDNKRFGELMKDYTDEIMKFGEETHERVSKEYEEQHKINVANGYLF